MNGLPRLLVSLYSYSFSCCQISYLSWTVCPKCPASHTSLRYWASKDQYNFWVSPGGGNEWNGAPDYISKLRGHTVGTKGIGLEHLCKYYFSSNFWLTLFFPFPTILKVQVDQKIHSAEHKQLTIYYSTGLLATKQLIIGHYFKFWVGCEVAWQKNTLFYPWIQPIMGHAVSNH